MDCERAIEILVEGPGVPPSDEDRAQAEAHCAECPKCARIRRGLALVDAAARPAAPPHLVDAIMDAVREQREMSQVEQRVLSGPAAPRPPEPAGLPSRWRWQGWERRFAGFAAAAAVVIAGLVALGLGLPRATQAPHKAVLQESVGTGAPEAAVTEHPYGDEATAALDAYRGTTAAAPPFVVLDGLVYRMTDEDLRLPSSATTAGAVVTALDDPASEPATATAYAEPLDKRTIWLRAADGRTLAFRLVTRTYANDEYALASGGVVARFGEWPTLPQRFAPPTSPDGSPTFRFFGSDDRGVRIYVPPGGRPQDGFAIAPGTPESDPAAGNPWWTWWTPLD